MQLNENFLVEVFKLALKNKDFYQICKQHLKYHYLPTEAYKELWKKIQNYTTVEINLPTVGILNQNFSSLSDVKLKNEIEGLLAKIVSCETPDLELSINTLEIYIRDSMASEFLSKAVDEWNKGNKEKVSKDIISFSKEVEHFTLKQGEYYNKLFKDFSKRQSQRGINSLLNSHIKIKAYFGIDSLDELTDGIEETDMAAFLAQSGIGKTKLSRWIAVQNAIRGLDSVLYALEGSKDQAEDGLDRTWTGLTKFNLNHNIISIEEKEQIDYALNNIKGEVYIENYEHFGSRCSTLDIRKKALDLFKILGYFPHLFIIDYFELLDDAERKNYGAGAFGEKMRRRQIAKELKDIATEFKTRFIVFTQGSDIEADLLNDERFVMTRHNCSGDKNFVDAFAYFFTINQTRDEKHQDIIRIYTDKLRHSSTGKTENSRINKIITNYDYERFYDRKRTLEMLGVW